MKYLFHLCCCIESDPRCGPSPVSRVMVRYTLRWAWCQGSQIVTSIFTICGENPFISVLSISAVCKDLHWLQLEAPFLFQQGASPSPNMWYFNVHWCQHWGPGEGWWLGWWDHDTGTISAGCGPWLMTARLCIQTQITASHPGITPQTLTPRHREDQRGHVNVEQSLS